MIKSIQSGTISMTSGESSKTATITSVNTAKSVIGHLGQSTASTSTVEALIRLTLTNATTVTATRNGFTADSTVAWIVAEYY